MKIAVSAEDSKGLDSHVSHHFGRCPYFVMADVEDGEVLAVDVIENPHFQGHKPGEVPEFVRANDANVVICGGMGRRAIAIFAERQIEAATGATGSARLAIEQYLAGELREATPCRQSVDHASSGGHSHHDGW